MKTWPVIPGRAVLLGCAVLLVSGCGGGEDETSSTPEVREAPAGAPVKADSKADRQIGLDFRRYMVRNCPEQGEELPDKVKDRFGPHVLPIIERQFEDAGDYCASVRSIEVKDKRITVRSDLDPGEAGAGEAFCVLVRGSDVSDSTPFHTLLDRDGGKIKVCGTRNAYR